MPFFSFLTKQNSVKAELVSEYASLCEKVSEIFASVGLHILPFTDPSFERFRQHPDPLRVLEVLKTYAEVLTEAQEAGESLSDDRMLLWRMISRMGMTPCPDLFKNLESGDCIEIYTTDNWQIYRNLTFFKYWEMSVDEMSVFVWNRDGKRSVQITQEGLRLIFLLKMGWLRQSFRLQSIPPHPVEIFAAGRKQRFMVDLKMASPLRIGNSMEAFVSTHRAFPIPSEVH